MDSVKRAADVLHQAEANLRGLVSDAAASGDYASVVQIAAWARTVSELVQATPGQPPKTPSSAPQTQQTMAKVSTAPRRAVRPAEDAYPRFFRHGDHLIRIAWSKKEKKEYQHKAPRAVIDALTKAMVGIGSDGRVFSTDQFLPLHDSDSGEVPSYQVYVGIALLKQAGLIDQHGRQGYSIPRMAEFKDAVESVWRKLPQQ